MHVSIFGEFIRSIRNRSKHAWAFERRDGANKPHGYLVFIYMVVKLNSKNLIENVIVFSRHRVGGTP